MSIPKRQLHKAYRDTRTKLEKRVESLENNVTALNALVIQLRARLERLESNSIRALPVLPPDSPFAPQPSIYPVVPPYSHPNANDLRVRETASPVQS